MSELTANEISLATRTVLWFAGGSGETCVGDVASLCNIEPEVLHAWASDEGYLWGHDGDMASMSILPFAWAHFAPTSKVCYAYHTALKAAAEADPKVAAWLAGCTHDLSSRFTA